MSRPEQARDPVPDTTADWYRSFEAELASHGLPTSEVERTAASTRAEAEAAGVTPGDLYGPAVLYAREVASALRDYQADVPAPTAAAPVVLRLRDVSARRGRHTVLSGINLTIHRGEVVAVVGANGAGKSTLLQLCAGLLRASGGSIERTPNFGYAPQLDSLAPLLTVDEHLRLFGAARGIRQGRSVSSPAWAGPLAETRPPGRSRAGPSRSSTSLSPSSTRPICSCWTSPTRAWTPWPTRTCGPSSRPGEPRAQASCWSPTCCVTSTWSTASSSCRPRRRTQAGQPTECPNGNGERSPHEHAA